MADLFDDFDLDIEKLSGGGINYTTRSEDAKSGCGLLTIEQTGCIPCVPLESILPCPTELHCLNTNITCGKVCESKLNCIWD